MLVSLILSRSSVPYKKNPAMWALFKVELLGIIQPDVFMRVIFPCKQCGQSRR